MLLYIREHALNGTLSIDGPPGGALAGEHFFAFERGALTQAWIATGVDRLGDLLVESKVIPNAARKDAEVVHQATRQLMGEIFVEMGLCDASAIARALTEQSRRRALRIFGIGDTAYRFYQDSDLLQGFGKDRFAIDVLPLVWAGVQASPPNATVTAVLSRVGDGEIRLRASAQLDAFAFADDVQHILDVLRLGPARVRDLESFAKDPQLARLLAYTLLTSKQAELVPQERKAAAAPVAPAAQPAAPVPASDPKAREADELFAAMDEQTYYEMLGVQKNASMDEIRAAFMKLAAKWHPDRAPAAAKESFQRVFALVNEAHQTLSDETMRTRYTRIATDGGGTPAAQRKVNAIFEASNLAQKAEIHHRRREYAEAEKLAREAVSLHAEDPAVLTVLGVVLLERADAASLDEAIAALSSAVKLAEKNDRAHVSLANAFKRKGDQGKALEHYRLAIEANPKNIEAAREVRLAEMRDKLATKEPDPKDAPLQRATAAAQGLINKLFKR